MMVIKRRAAMECPREELIGVPGTSSELKRLRERTLDRQQSIES